MNRPLLCLGLAAALVACGSDDHADHDPGDGCGGHAGHAHDGCGEEGHAHEARHGGTVVELGDHAAFAEVREDHDAGSVQLWVYVGETMEPGAPDVAPVLNLKTADGPKQLTGKGEGSGPWTFTDEALKGHADGRLRVEVGGKTYQADLPHDH